MKSKHLLVSELDYELRIRNIVTARDRADKQKILSKLLQKETDQGSSLIALIDPNYNFTLEQIEINLTLDGIKIT